MVEQRGRQKEAQHIADARASVPVYRRVRVFGCDRAVSRARRPRAPSIKPIVKNASTDTNCAKPMRRRARREWNDRPRPTTPCLARIRDFLFSFRSIQFRFFFFNTFSGSWKNKLREHSQPGVLESRALSPTRNEYSTAKTRIRSFVKRSGCRRSVTRDVYTFTDSPRCGSSVVLTSR